MGILINDNSARVQYTATAGQTVFAVPFEFFENADLKIIKNGSQLTLTSDYTITGAGVTGGGAITLVSGALLGDIITIVRDIAVKRVTDFPLSGPFNIEALNTDLDRLTAIAQEAETQLDARVLRLADSDQPSTLSPIPDKASRVAKLFYWDSDGQPAVLAADAVADLQQASDFLTQTFTGNGSQTLFTLSANPLNIKNLDVFVDGVRQVPDVNYTLSGVSLTMASAVPNGSTLFCKWGQVIPVGEPGNSGGGVQTYYQAAPPASANAGDLWFDTDNGNKNYRYDGTNWVSVQDGAIADAAAEAALAVETANDALDLISAAADGLIDSYYQATAPSVGNEGDLWFDTDDNNKLYRWTSGAWALAADNRIATALTNAAGAQATADGKVKTFFATSAPTADGLGDLWFDTDDNNKLYRWNGSSWALAQDQNIPTAISNAALALSTANEAIALAEAASDGFINSYFQTSAPSVAATGDIWFDTDDGNKIYRYSGSAWVAARDTGITSAVTAANSAAADAATALSTASTAQATADGKVTTFYTNTTPTADGVGDLWYRPSTGIVSRWSGSAWQDVATLGANWASNLAGIPTELLDNRLATAISSSGLVNANRVTTSSIQANGVSSVTVASSTSSVNINSSTTVVQQVTFTTSGGTILIRGTFGNYSQPVAAGTHGIQFYLQSSPGGIGTQLAYSSQYAAGGGSTYQFRDQCVLETVATPAAGTYTIYLYAQLLNSNSQAATLSVDRVLSVTELKR